ncbi:MAG: hypothetical protein NTW96_04230, partial [Planctomycetia bacterium]|nr:hypothetical protein [Planctomycetia bacterium]
FTAGVTDPEKGTGTVAVGQIGWGRTYPGDGTSPLFLHHPLGWTATLAEPPLGPPWTAVTPRKSDFSLTFGGKSVY